MNTRCKFKLTEIREYANWEGKTFVFTAEYDSNIPEDKRFAQYTPNGRFEMTVTNPSILERYKVGTYYYFDISPVENWS